MRIAILTLFVAMVFPAQFGAAAPSSWGLLVKAGGAFGTLNRPTKDGKIETFRLGGFPVGAGFVRDLSLRLSVSGLGSLMIDVPNQAVVRQGFEGGISWHLLGGPRRVVVETKEATIVSTNPSQFSLAIRGGLFNYGASTKSLSAEVSGSILESLLGLEYRFGSVGLTLFFTAFSVPSSTERLTSRFGELAIYWRN